MSSRSPSRSSARAPSSCLKVVGDSMIDAAICDGDCGGRPAAADRRQWRHRRGDADNEVTVKTFKRRTARWLMPHNADFSPIDGDHATILGKVTAVLRRTDLRRI